MGLADSILENNKKKEESKSEIIKSENKSQVSKYLYMNLDAMRLISELQGLISTIEKAPDSVNNIKLFYNIKGYLGEKGGSASYKYKFKGYKRKGLL